MDQIIGQIQAFAFNFPPRQWAFCDGQILSISSNTALFSLIGTTFGGNGQSTFALPDLRGRSIVHPGQGPGLSDINWGQKGGTESMYITVANMPAHAHTLVNGQAIVNTIVGAAGNSPTNESENGANSLGSGGSFLEIYSEGVATADKIGSVTSTISGSTSTVASSIPLNSRNPYLGIYTSIALQGIFPSRN